MESDEDTMKKENAAGGSPSKKYPLTFKRQALWLLPVLVAGAAAGVWAYSKVKQKSNVHIMALNLVRDAPLILKKKQTMLDLFAPSLSQRSISSCWVGEGNESTTLYC